MFSTRVLDCEIIGFFKCDGDVNMKAENYC